MPSRYWSFEKNTPESAHKSPVASGVSIRGRGSRRPGAQRPWEDHPKTQVRAQGKPSKNDSAKQVVKKTFSSEV